MNKSIITLYSQKHIDGVLVAKALTNQLQKSDLVKSVEMLTITENRNYDCYYIFVASEDALKLGEIIDCIWIKYTLLRLNNLARDEWKIPREEENINVVDILCNTLGLCYINLDEDLDRGTFYKPCKLSNKKDSVEFECVATQSVIHYLRLVQNYLLETDKDINSMLSDFHTHTDNAINQGVRHALLADEDMISNLSGFLSLKTIGISHAISLINKIKLM